VVQSNVACDRQRERSEKKTVQHIKSFFESTIFTYAKNEGAFDGVTQSMEVLIPRPR